jgi:hypothetical protein
MYDAQTEGEANALKFSQIFHLAPAAGSYVVSNGEPFSSSVIYFLVVNVGLSRLARGYPLMSQSYVLS